jgi:hypothetical protein
MLTCKLDGTEFEDKESALDHLRDKHCNLIDEELAEFMSEAETNVFEQQFDGEEEEEEK